MNFWLIVVGMIAAIVIYASWKTEMLIELVVCSLIAVGITSCHQSDWYQDSMKEDAIRDARQAQYEATPRVVREVDGCKVYTFKGNGNWHFFTKCGEKTTTDTTQTYECGTPKARKTCSKIESITMENVK
jgi:hypothetical protein